MSEMTTEEKITSYETMLHILTVQGFLTLLITELQTRLTEHDHSKLLSPELEVFTKVTARLKTLTYGSDEYKQCLIEMGPALEHHYAHNRHHPEHFGTDGIEGMTLIDLMEMLCDWKAATLRHADGDMGKSLDINAARFSIDRQLMMILRNTADLLGLK